MSVGHWSLPQHSGGWGSKVTFTTLLRWRIVFKVNFADLTLIHSFNAKVRFLAPP
jgi:hypothetical protein